jgi:hypothetical protein
MMAADRQIHRGLLSQGGWGSGRKEEEEEGEEEGAGSGEEEGAEIAEVETSVRPKLQSDKRMTTPSAGLFACISAPDQASVFSITEALFFGAFRGLHRLDGPVERV